ncbi:hypothetical protein LPJ61_002779 [Coemansia biformis]|uniref:Uncharacterized protein n=1 Tax=Coemansia biformis TaxID=1286918 RepID=A0A9W7YCG2_9FUNG|nr:hypothetical protein LPJ61_002779 [Coemansia biformis]
MIPQQGGPESRAHGQSPRGSLEDGERTPEDDGKGVRGTEDYGKGAHSAEDEHSSDSSHAKADAWAEGDGSRGLGSHARRLRRAASRYKRWVVGIAWVLITAYFVAGLAVGRKTQTSDVLPFIFLYVFITGRIAFYFVPTQPLTTRIGRACGWADRTLVQLIPGYQRYLAGGLVLVALFLSVSLGLGVGPYGGRLARMQSFLGIVVITGVLVGTSRNPKHINWRTVLVGYLMQFCLGCIVLKTRWGSDLFSWLAEMASGFLAFSRFGAGLLFGQGALNSGAIAVTLFPAIIFFASFVQILYYLGGVQWLLKRMGWFFYRLLGTSGAEAIVASASPFIGQSENTLLVKDYLEHMTKSELHACMTAGFATISGSVFQAYVALGVDAKNLITACIMSIPCSLALSKIRYPETDQPITRGRVVLSKREKEANVLHAMGNGAATGMNLSLLILATIIGMVSLINAINFVLTWLGQFVGIANLTMELVLGYLFYPLTWLLGVPAKDVFAVSQLLGLKLIGNEFIAYSRLVGADGSPAVRDTLSERGLLIAQFALAGFANTGSVAQVIAGIGSLAPSRKGDVARLAVSACLTGAVATMMTSAIVAMVA